MFIKKIFAIILSALFITSCSDAVDDNPLTTTGLGKITGIVTESGTNNPLSFAQIKTYPPTTEIYSEIDGTFIINNVNPGEYTVYAYIEGHDGDSVSIMIQQSDSVNINFQLVSFKEYLDYYPLDIGNYWVYNQVYSVEIKSDTLINGVSYRVIGEAWLASGELYDTRYERVDSNSALVYRFYPEYNKDFIIDSLPAKAGQKFTSNMFYRTFYISDVCVSICSSIETNTVLGYLTKVKNLYHFCALDQPHYFMAKGIGITYIWYFRNTQVHLNYAVIRGVEYGEI